MDTSTPGTVPDTPNWMADQLIIGRADLTELGDRLKHDHRPLATMIAAILEEAEHDRIWVPIAPTFVPAVVSALNAMKVKVGGTYDA